MRTLMAMILAAFMMIPVNANALGTAETNILAVIGGLFIICLLYTSPSPRD